MVFVPFDSGIDQLPPKLCEANEHVSNNVKTCGVHRVA